MTARMSTRDKLRVVAHDEGWTPFGPPCDVDQWQRGELVVAVGYTYRGRLEWIALMRNTTSGVEPLARYGLFQKVEPGTEGGEISLRVRNKAAIAMAWLERGDGAL